jgi:hypothetical protein
MKLARAEYETVVARLRVQTGLTHAPPPAADEVYEAGDSFYVHHEKSRAWTGPHLVVSVDGKEIVVDVYGRHAE